MNSTSRNCLLGVVSGFEWIAIPIDGDRMQRTNLHWFYQLGTMLEPLTQMMEQRARVNPRGYWQNSLRPETKLKT